jgi:hypothetical protein
VSADTNKTAWTYWICLLIFFITSI